MPQTKTISIGLVSILFAFLISGCVSVSDKNMQNYRLKSVPLTKNTQTQASSVIYELYQQHREWQGVRYRLGGQSKVGVDCSGFVQLTYQSKLGVYLPRTAKQQSKLGTQIQKRELEAGDLVFFRTGPTSKHVGIYLEKNKFLHVSQRKGVTISRLDNVYWQSKYWKSVRL